MYIGKYYFRIVWEIKHSLYEKKKITNRNMSPYGKHTLRFVILKCKKITYLLRCKQQRHLQ